MLADGVSFYGVQGQDNSTGTGGIGVLGESVNGYGVEGSSLKNDGVLGYIYGDGTGQSGVYGYDTTTGAGGGYGVTGTSANGTGVYASGPLGLLAESASGTGVHGVSVAISNVSAGVVAGVWGDSTTHAGVVGTSAESNGVIGLTKGAGQAGVLGSDESSGGGIGVSAASTNGTALQVDGVASFSRSGLESIAAGKTTQTVTGVALTTASLVMANLQKSLPGVEAVVPDVSASSFKIFLSEAVPAGESAKVGWFVVN